MDLIEKIYSAASRKWMYPKGSKFPRPFRKFLLDSGYIAPGQPITAKFKKLSCKNPVVAFYKVYGRKPSEKEIRYLKKLACEALKRNDRNE